MGELSLSRRTAFLPSFKCLSVLKGEDTRLPPLPVLPGTVRDLYLFLPLLLIIFPDPIHLAQIASDPTAVPFLVNMLEGASDSAFAVEALRWLAPNGTFSLKTAWYKATLINYLTS